MLGPDEVEELTREVYVTADETRASLLRVAAIGLGAAPDAHTHAVIGGALLVVYKLEQRLEDLAASIEHFQAACAAEPTPSRLANLGSALLERAGLPGRGDADADRSDHRRGLEALTAAIELTPEDEPAWVTRATTLLSAQITALDQGFPGATLDATLDLGERVVAAARRHGTGAGEPQNLLGGALMTAALLGSPRGDLDRATALLEESVAQLPPTHPDRAARLGNWGAALLDLFEEHGDPQRLQDAIARNREAFVAAREHDRQRPLIANNLLNALVAGVRASGDPALLAEARSLFDLLLTSFLPGDGLYPIARSNLGNAAHAAYQAEQDLRDLDASIRWHTDAIEATHPDDPSGPSRHAALAVALTARQHASGDEDDLTRALEHARHALRADRVAAHELARHRSDLGNLLHEAFLRSGRISDLDQAARLHREGLAALPPGNPATAGVLNNVAITLSDRYDRLGEPDDLETAIAALEHALTLTGRGHPEAPARLANLATSYHRRFTVTGDLDDLDRAERAAAEAVRGTVHPDIAAVAYSVEVRIAAERWAMHPGPEERERLQALNRDGRDGERRPGAVAQRWFRQAFIHGLLGEPRDDLLRAAAREGLEARPAVTLEAGRQLALDALARQADGASDARADVEEGVELAAQALARLTSRNTELRHVLAWRRDAAGLAATAAHSHVLAGDARGAVEAFEAGHAAILAGHVDAPVPAAARDELVVRLWSTDAGGGAIVERDGSARAIVLPALTSEVVSRLVRRLNVAAQLGSASLGPVLARGAVELGRALRPLLGELTPGTPVTWCAGGPVAMLPIGIVPSPHGGRVLEQHRLRHAPTFAIARWARAAARGRRLDQAAARSFAAPAPSAFATLDGARSEAAHFAAPEHRYEGARATRERAIAALGEGALVHFACHARTTAHDPLASHLLLAGDTPLFAQELLELRSTARMVVLAACDTAAVRGSFADEALGLASALHLSGVPGVVASLWTVPDRATSVLMRDFADRLWTATDPGEALREAALAAVATNLAAAGAFVLLGA